MKTMMTMIKSHLKMINNNNWKIIKSREKVKKSCLKLINVAIQIESIMQNNNAILVIENADMKIYQRNLGNVRMINYMLWDFVCHVIRKNIQKIKKE